MTVLLKLFTYCVKVHSNRQELIKPEMNTIAIMLGALNLVNFNPLTYSYTENETNPTYETFSCFQ